MWPQQPRFDSWGGQSVLWDTGGIGCDLIVMNDVVAMCLDANCRVDTWRSASEGVGGWHPFWDVSHPGASLARLSPVEILGKVWGGSHTCGYATLPGAPPGAQLGHEAGEELSGAVATYDLSSWLGLGVSAGALGAFGYTRPAGCQRRCACAFGYTRPLGVSAGVLCTLGYTRLAVRVGSGVLW